MGKNFGRVDLLKEKSQTSTLVVRGHWKTGHKQNKPLSDTIMSKGTFNVI